MQIDIFVNVDPAVAPATTDMAFAPPAFVSPIWPVAGVADNSILPGKGPIAVIVAEA